MAYRASCGRVFKALSYGFQHDIDHIKRPVLARNADYAAKYHARRMKAIEEERRKRRGE